MKLRFILAASISTVLIASLCGLSSCTIPRLSVDLDKDGKDDIVIDLPSNYGG